MAIPANEDIEFDGQTQSETFDEDKQALTSDGRSRSEMRTFDQLADIEDLTSRPEDASDQTTEGEAPLALDEDPQRPDTGVTSRTRGIDPAGKSRSD